MNDVSLITPEILRDVLQDRVGEGTDTFETIGAREPVLAAYVSKQMLEISGTLALSGAPPEVVRGCYYDLLRVISVSIRAVWRAHDLLWKDTDLDKITRLRPRPRPASRSRPGARPAPRKRASSTGQPRPASSPESVGDVE